MIFQEIQNRLKGLTLDLPIENDNEENNKLMANAKRRSSLVGDVEMDLKEIHSARRIAKNGQDALALGDIGRIDEEDEDLEESIISKSDELENCKKLLKEYSDLIKEMSEAMSLMDEEKIELQDENKVLEANMQMGDEQIEEYKIELRLKDEELENIIDLFDEEKMKAEKAFDEKEDAVRILKRFRKDHEEKEVIIIRENENMVEENIKIAGELTEMKKRLSSLNHVHSSIDLKKEQVENSNRDLVERLEIFQNDNQVLEDQMRLAGEDNALKIREIEIVHEEAIQNLETRCKENAEKIRELEQEAREKDERILELESREKFPTREANSSMNRLNSYLETSQQLHFNDDSILRLDANHNTSNLLKGLDYSTNHGMLGIQEDEMEMDDAMSVDRHLEQELELKTAELETRQKELETVRDNYQQEIHSLNKQFRELRRNTEFELSQVKNKLKYVKKKAAKNKAVYERQIGSLNGKVISLKIKTSEAIVDKDKLEMGMMRGLRLEQAKVAEYEKMIREHNREAQAKKSQGFFRSILNF